jgi:hypothetical protein
VGAAKSHDSGGGVTIRRLRKIERSAIYRFFGDDFRRW